MTDDTLLRGPFENAAFFILSTRPGKTRARDIHAHSEFVLGTSIRKHTFLDALRRLAGKGWLERSSPRVVQKWRFRAISGPQEQPHYVYYQVRPLPRPFLMQLRNAAARYFGFRDAYDLAQLPYLEAAKAARKFHSSRAPRPKHAPVPSGGRLQEYSTTSETAPYEAAALQGELSRMEAMTRAACTRGHFSRTTQRMIRRYAKQQLIRSSSPSLYQPSSSAPHLSIF